MTLPKKQTKSITEGTITLEIPAVDIVSKEMGTFYNPVMQFNRDITILFLNALPEKGSVADVMAATGVRSMRIFKECKNKSIIANDASKEAVKTIEKNCKKNKILFVQQKKFPEKEAKTKKLFLFNTDANQLLLESKGFFYIEIDPFGSPNPFLDAALKRVSRGGYIGVTATDTAALCGTYETACTRKYDAKPLRTFMMHEVGLRILIKKVQTIGAQYDKAMIPVFTFSKDHYMRIFFRCEKSKEAVDEMIKKQAFLLFCSSCFSMKISEWNKETCVCEKEYEYAGKMWTNNLWDEKIVHLMQKQAKEKRMKEFLAGIDEERKAESMFMYDISKICKKYKCDMKPLHEVVTKLQEKGNRAARTHVCEQGIRTTAQVQEIVQILIEKN